MARKTERKTLMRGVSPCKTARTKLGETIQFVYASVNTGELTMTEAEYVASKLASMMGDLYNKCRRLEQ